MYGYLFIKNFNPEFFLPFQGEKSYIAYPLINQNNPYTNRTKIERTSFSFLAILFIRLIQTSIFLFF